MKNLRGVVDVTSGYAGGQVDQPTYEQVSGGQTGHAEAVQIKFDPTVISYRQILEVFWLTHSPTRRNRQGNDIGPQYRSAIFYHSEEQKRTAEVLQQEYEQQQIFSGPMVTEIVPFTNFWPAEEYHQNYFEKNPDQPYCQTVIDPKIAKLRQKFAPLLKASR